MIEHEWIKYGIAHSAELPFQTRFGITHTFIIDTVQSYITVGFNETGQLIELFLTTQKEGSTIGGFADAFARLFSTSLQAGVPLATLIHRTKGLCFNPNGLTTNPKIPTAKSIPDYIAQWLEQNFIINQPPIPTSFNNPQ